MSNPFDDRRYLIPFRSLLLPHIFTDTLVIGAGVAGMRAALAAARHGDVIVLTKGELDVSSTAWAQGGVAVAASNEPSLQLHIDDTVNAGAGLCAHDAVKVLVHDGPHAIEQMRHWGMRFDSDAKGNPARGREGAHSEARVLHTDGAATGREFVRCLSEAMLTHDAIRTFEHCFALDLLTNGATGERGEPRVLGAVTHHPRYGLQIIWAKGVILANGGAGQVYRETTNPSIITGDGMAMAYRAGAQVADMEFIQFHPTTLYVAGSGRSLISEAVRGEGAYLVDRRGERFMPQFHELAELAPRDVVSRAIMDLLSRTQEPAVYLDARHLGSAFAQRFPNLAATLQTYDLDPERDLIPVHPSAHYTIGGVWTDLHGRTNLPGLYACGEVACTGLHGANRLASNSLLEGLVYGARAGAAAAEMADHPHGPMKIISEIPTSERGELDLVDVRSSLRSVMWRNVSIERTGGKLRDVLDMFSFWARYTLDSVFDDPAGWETQNLLTVGMLITRSAIWREESRGVHYRTDHAIARDDLLVHARWLMGANQPDLHPRDQAPAAVAVNHP
jgi:L-aspartate oxidase